MENNEDIKFRQMCFDKDGNIKPEVIVTRREMTSEKKEEYERIIADANQMTIFDFLE